MNVNKSLQENNINEIKLDPIYNDKNRKITRKRTPKDAGKNRITLLLIQHDGSPQIGAIIYK